MFSRVIEWALRNQTIVFGSVAMLCIAGFYSALRLPVDAVPDITNVQSMVITKTGALDPQKVEATVTYVIETELQGIPKVEEIRSISKYGLSQIVIVFEEDTNIYLARQQISERLNQVQDSLPAGIVPELAPLSTGLGEVFFYLVEPKPDSELAKKPEKERLIYLRTVQDYIMRQSVKQSKTWICPQTYRSARSIHALISLTKL